MSYRMEVDGEFEQACQECGSDDLKLYTSSVYRCFDCGYLGNFNEDFEESFEKIRKHKEDPEELDFDD